MLATIGTVKVDCMVHVPFYLFILLSYTIPVIGAYMRVASLPFMVI